MFQTLDPFEDTDIGESKPLVMKFKFDELKKYFIDILIGKGPFLTRSVNILHVLGSVTVNNKNIRNNESGFQFFKNVFFMTGSLLR